MMRRFMDPAWGISRFLLLINLLRYTSFSFDGFFDAHSFNNSYKMDNLSMLTTKEKRYTLQSQVSPSSSQEDIWKTIHELFHLNPMKLL